MNKYLLTIALLLLPTLANAQELTIKATPAEADLIWKGLRELPVKDVKCLWVSFVNRLWSKLSLSRLFHRLTILKRLRKQNKMPHFSHSLKAYMGEPNKPLVFCAMCGKEENEVEINQPCAETFYVRTVDLKTEKVHPKFISGLPD